MISFPLRTTSPVVGRSSPERRERRVVLPQPDFPTRETNSPASTVIDTPLTTFRFAILFGQTLADKILFYSCLKTSEGLILEICLPNSAPVRPPITMESRKAKEARVQGI